MLLAVTFSVKVKVAAVEATSALTTPVGLTVMFVIVTPVPLTGVFVMTSVFSDWSTSLTVAITTTAKTLPGHIGIHILTYLHTNKKRQREADRKRQGIDLEEPLTELYNQVKNGNIEIRVFIEKVRFLIKNG